MITEAQIAERSTQPTIGIRTQTPVTGLPTVIPQLIDETEAWLQAKGAESAGAPFVRYHTINMEDKLDIEIGWPLVAAVAGEGQIIAGEIPAGRYAGLIYTDVTKGIEGNGALIEWARDNGHAWDAWDTPQGEAFASRVEFMLDGPDDDPDPANWRTEVIIKLAD